jgi:hypothetical protein
LDLTSLRPPPPPPSSKPRSRPQTSPGLPLLPIRSNPRSNTKGGSVATQTSNTSTKHYPYPRSFRAISLVLLRMDSHTRDILCLVLRLSKQLKFTCKPFLTLLGALPLPKFIARRMNNFHSVATQTSNTYTELYRSPDQTSDLAPSTNSTLDQKPRSEHYLYPSSDLTRLRPGQTSDQLKPSTISSSHHNSLPSAESRHWCSNSHGVLGRSKNQATFFFILRYACPCISILTFVSLLFIFFLYLSSNLYQLFFYFDLMKIISRFFAYYIKKKYIPTLFN